MDITINEHIAADFFSKIDPSGKWLGAFSIIPPRGIPTYKFTDPVTSTKHTLYAHKLKYFLHNAGHNELSTTPLPAIYETQYEEVPLIVKQTPVTPDQYKAVYDPTHPDSNITGFRSEFVSKGTTRPVYFPQNPIKHTIEISPAFVPEPFTITYIDPDPSNLLAGNLDNLYMATSYADKRLIIPKSHKLKPSELTNQQQQNLIARYESGLSTYQLSQEFNLIQCDVQTFVEEQTNAS